MKLLPGMLFYFDVHYSFSMFFLVKIFMTFTINMDKPEIVNDIIIAQSGYGTDYIGRFDIELDENKKISDWKWERVSITDQICSFDEELDALADNAVMMRKPVRRALKIGTLAGEYRHESRLYETELGDIISDAFKEIYGAELVILQSGSIRRKSAGPEISEKDMRELYPFDDAFLTVDISGSELLEMFEFLFSLKEDGSVMNGTFQYSRGLRLVVDGEDCFNKGCRILKFTLDGKEISPHRNYRVGVTRNCFENFRKYFNMPMDEKRAVTVGISSYHDLARWFLSQNEPVSCKDFGRFEILNFER
ncbi:MAG: 5'-nucleotidase C-terminal domain-containing protein [Oscillospiraceae bacterium]|nr:5'-nucleotidase C-terminal domain-containing protein [Oscillospiraceae bacterium]